MDETRQNGAQSDLSGSDVEDALALILGTGAGSEVEASGAVSKGAAADEAATTVEAAATATSEATPEPQATATSEATAASKTAVAPEPQATPEPESAPESEAAPEPQAASQKSSEKSEGDSPIRNSERPSQPKEFPDEPTNARHFSPEEPLEKKPAWPIVVAALIIFIVVTGGLTFFIRFTMSQNAAELAAIKAEGDRHLNEAITLIQEADTIVIAFDNTNENKVTEEALPQLEALLDQIPSAQETLDVAITKAELAQTTYVTAEDKQLAQYAIDAATARKDMLDLSSQLTSYDIAAMLCAVEFSTAWDLLIAADGDMRLAVEVVNENGNGAVGQAMEYNQAADDKLTQAQEAIARASELLPEADFSSIVNYLTAKRESVALAIASDEALLADDIAGANRLNDEFVSKDAQVVELATLIPEEPISLIVNAYDEATSEVRTAYHTARDLAADADAFLRAFVGTNVRAQ